MAITPGTYNMTVQRRADHSVQLVFKDNNNTAINLTGFTIAAQVWDEPRSNKYADFAVTYTNRTGGVIDIKLTDTTTAAFTPNELKYDVLLTEPDGDKYYYLEGTLYISEGYTA